MEYLFCHQKDFQVIAEQMESFTAMTRAGSTTVTGGTGNFLVATAEALSSGVLTLLAFTIPFFAAALVIGLLIMALAKLSKFFTSKKRKRQSIE